MTPRKTNENLWRTALLTVCLVASSALVFADGKDVSGKIWNADCEKGLSGWEVTFSSADNKSGYIWRTSAHNEGPTSGQGYWGHSGHCLEVWGGLADGVGQPVGKNSISQRVTDLPNGTYVFGAFTIATIQDYVNTYEPTQGSVEGAYMFAGDTKVPIATNNPEVTDSVTWGHAVKLNVATQVTDGTLSFGFGCDATTTASFVCFDNATLYYFGDTAPEEALAGAYRMDLDKAIAAADTLQASPMAAAERAALTAAVEGAAAASTVQECMDAEENVRLVARSARYSIYTYALLAQAIERAKEVLAKEWSDDVADAVAALQESLAKAEADSRDGAVPTDEMDAYVATFTNAIDMVEADALYDYRDALEEFINFPEVISADAPNLLCGDSHPGFGEEPGQYPESEQEVLTRLLEEVDELLDQISTGSVPAAESTAMMERIRVAVAQCMANANVAPHLPMDVIFIPDPGDPSKPFVTQNQGEAGTDGAYMRTFKSKSEASGEDCFRYQSPLITLPYPIERLVMSVIHTVWADRSANAATDGPYFNISEFYLYDENGTKIDLTAADFTSNAKEAIEGSYAEICDGRVAGGCFHSAWSKPASPEGYYHNLSVNMPEGMTKFSLAIEIQWVSPRLYNMPTEVVFSSMSRIRADLAKAVERAEETDLSGYQQGSEIGFYSGDFGAIRALPGAIAEARRVLDDGDATDEAMAKALQGLQDALAAAEDAAQALTLVLPDDGVSYSITNQAPFVQNQAKVKCMTVLQDSILWWADADADDEYQQFVFEPVATPEGARDGDVFRAVKNVKTGKYIGPFTELHGSESGSEIVWGNAWHIRLAEKPTPILIKTLGSGQLQLWSAKDIIETDWLCLHACNHNNGHATQNPGAEGGGKGGTHPDGYSVHGVCGPIVQWAEGAGSASAWCIRQLETLPAQLTTAEAFGTVHHLLQPVSTLTIQADKPCSFATLTVKDIMGNSMNCAVTKRDANTVTVSFAQLTETFCLDLGDDEGITAVTLTGLAGGIGDSALAKLMEAYNNAASINYDEGTAIGQVSNLTPLREALAGAEALLANPSAATDEALLAALEQIQNALANLTVVMPDENKSYLIVNATPKFEEVLGVPVAIYSNPDNKMPGWTYLSINNPNFEWVFEYIDDTRRNFRLYNVGTQNYLSGTTGADNVMNATGGLYTLVARGEQKFNILNTDEGAQNDGSLAGTWIIHANGHQYGSSPFGSICFWGNESTLSEWYIVESGSLRTSIDEVSVEPEPIPVADGIYDLTGRRISSPEKGLYIVNGKKVLIR